eukprot:161111_1
MQGSINEENMNCSPISSSRSYLITPPRVCGVDDVVCEGLDKEVELGVEKETPKGVIKNQLESLNKLKEEIRQNKRRCNGLELALKESNNRVKALEHKEKEKKKKVGELEGRLVQTSTAWKQAEQSLTRNRKRAEELGNEKYNLLKKLKQLQEERSTAKRSSDEEVNLRKENEKLNKRCSLLDVTLGEYKAVEKAAISDLEALAEALSHAAYKTGTAVALPSPFPLEEGRRRKGKLSKPLNRMEEVVVKLSNEVHRLTKEWKAARDGRKETLKEAAETRLSCEELYNSLDAAREELSKALSRSTILEEKLSKKSLTHTTLLEASAAAGESLSRLLPSEEREVLESSLSFAETDVEQDDGDVLMGVDTKVHLNGLRALTNSSTLDIENEPERGLVRKARLVPLCAWRLGQILENGAQAEEELASMKLRIEEADHSAERLTKELNYLKSAAREQKHTENLNAVRASECEKAAKASAERAMVEVVAEKETNSALATHLKAQAVELQHCKQLKESAEENEQNAKSKLEKARVELTAEKENNAVLAGHLKTQTVELRRCEDTIESAMECQQITKADAKRAKGELAAEKENNATLAEHLKIQASKLQRSEELKDSGKESLRLMMRFLLPFRAQLYELKSQKRFLLEQFHRYSPVQEALRRAASCIEGRNYWALPQSLHAVDIQHAVVTHPVEGDCLRLPPCFRSVAIAVLAAHRMINLMHMNHQFRDERTEKEGERIIDVDSSGCGGGMASSYLTDWPSRKEGKRGSSFFSLPQCLPDSAVHTSPEFLSVDKLQTQAPEVSLHMLLNCVEAQTYQWTQHREVTNGNSLLTWLLRGNAPHYTRLAYLTERTVARYPNEMTCGVNRVLRARAAYVYLCKCLARGDMQRLSSLTRTTATLAREMNRLLNAEGKKMDSSCVLCEASKERERCTAEATAQAIKTLEAERLDAASLAHALHSKVGELKRYTLAAESALAIARKDRNETAESLRKAEGAVEQLKEEVYSLNKEKGEYTRQKMKVLHPLQHDLAAMRERCRELEQRVDRAEAEVVYLRKDAATVRSLEEQRKVLVHEQTVVLKSLEDIII